MKILLVLMAVLILTPGTAGAHGVDWRLEEAPAAAALRFFYSDQTPMAYSQVKIFSPQESRVEYQNARTDKNGGFVFWPDRPGLWKFEVSDGQGHRVAGEMLIAGPDEGSAAAPAVAGESGGGRAGESGGRILKIVLGLSLILNGGLAAARLKKGKKT